jgi:DNA-directed RNA polymerase subunit RPC12/RpoP
METIQCEYCNKITTKINLKRHQNTKLCRNKQLNLDIKLEIKEYKCEYCNKLFNRLDDKNDHELKCQFKDMYYKLSNKILEKEKELEQKNKELEIKDEIIKQKDNDIEYFKTQLQIYRPNINYTNYQDNSNVTNNITINNNININFSDIQNHLDKFNIHVLSDQSSLIKFIMPIFENKVKLINECKQIMSFYMNDKMINDIKCKVFLSNTAGQLTDISDKICIEGKNNKLLSDTIVKNACINNKLLNDISTEEGMKNGIRKKNPMILVHEIIKYLKENNIIDIKGV